MIRFNITSKTYLSNLSFESSLKPRNAAVKDDEKTFLLISSQTDTYIINVISKTLANV